MHSFLSFLVLPLLVASNPLPKTRTTAISSFHSTFSGTVLASLLSYSTRSPTSSCSGAGASVTTPPVATQQTRPQASFSLEASTSVSWSVEGPVSISAPSTYSSSASVTFPVCQKTDSVLISRVWMPSAPSATVSTVFKRKVESIPRKVTVWNQCNFPVHIQSVPGAGSFRGIGDQTVQPGGNYQEDLYFSCVNYQDPSKNCGGVSLKVTRPGGDERHPMQFEYTGIQAQDAATKQDTVYYDISLLDCLESTKGDPTQCVGHAGGLLALAGECVKYECPPGAICRDQAYFENEYGYKPGAPVGSCAASRGVAFVLCAGNGT